ncbi:hypothetical protein D0868_11376 [Hortaea werneckii]|uniref:UEV domain-containing protein n=1 Tax=Hortaea werneckii TaxID=91943 RepID=A0A3M6XZ66_HORWE|nr:hypothetical protein D0868_11376 [Hortaea werneckii]
MLTITFLSLLLQEYHDPQRTYTSVAQTLSAYPTLSPRTEVFTHETGRSALLLVLSGTLPTHFRGAEYRFPIKIWFPHTYPHEAPMVFVTPGGGMAIRPGQHVGTDGRVYHPYLRDWRGVGMGGWEDGGRGGSSLGEFLRVLIGVFEREPPVVSRVQSQQPQQQQSLQGNHVSGMTSSPRPPPSSSGSSLLPQLPPKQTHGSLYEPQQRQPQPPPPVEMSATTNSPPPPPKPPKPGQEPVFPERSTSRNLARDGPPLPPLPHERVGSAQYAASPPPSTPMYPNRTGSVSRPPPPPSAQGMSGYEAPAGQHGPPATPLAHQQFQQVRAAAAAAGGREGSPVSPIMPNGQGYDHRYSQQFMPGMQGNSPQHPGGGRASFQHHPNHHHQQQVPPQQPYHHQGQMNSPSYQHYPPNQLHPQYHQQPQQPLPPNQIPPTPQPTKPPPPPDLLTTDPFEISLPTDPTTNPGTHAPPIPPNPEKEHLLHALASTLSTQTQSKVSQNLQAVAPLQAQNSALRAAIGRLEKEVQGLEEWGRVLDSNEGILRRSIGECEGVVGRYKTAPSTTQQQDSAGGTTHPPIDEILVPPTLVANQLWTLCAEEASCREAMYVLQQAVDRGRVGGRDFVRLMRGLGREAFFKKALARKCARGLGLDDGVGTRGGLVGGG